MPNQIEEAIASAKEQNKPLFFLSTNNNSNWGPCDAASLAAISAAKKKCVVVALNVSDKDHRYDGLSPLVSRGFLNDKTGSTYPFAVIASSDQTVRYAELTFKDLSAKSNASKAITKALAEIETNKSAMPAKDTQLVINLKGSKYFVIYVTDVISDTEYKYSRKPNSTNGKLSSTSEKSPGFKRYIKRLMEIKSVEATAKREQLVKELMPKFEAERWTNSEGKAIRATFVSLDGENITLIIARKKNPSTFPLNKLNEVSQDRAKELAALITQAETKIKELE